MVPPGTEWGAFVSLKGTLVPSFASFASFCRQPFRADRSSLG
jgi:hypothetical protein